MKDYNTQKLKMAVKKLQDANFRQPWQFKIEIDGQPSDFDIYVKDVSYGTVIDIATEEHSAGGLIWTFPSKSNPVTVSMTCRDHHDLRIYRFFSDWSGKICNSDGTVNLPAEYLKMVKRYAISSSEYTESAENLVDQWEMYVTQLGDLTESREENNQFMTFPVVFTQFSNLGLTVGGAKDFVAEQQDQQQSLSSVHSNQGSGISAPSVVTGSGPSLPFNYF